MEKLFAVNNNLIKSITNMLIKDTLYNGLFVTHLKG